MGWGASHGGPGVQRAWPVILRVQILLTSAVLSLVAAWRLTTAGEVIAPLVLAGGLWVMFIAATFTRGSRSEGEGALESWAVSPNAAFWVVPTATAFAGPAGAMIAVLTNVANTAVGAVWIHLMRRDAPINQRRSTSWVDQSPLLASAVGLLLHLVGECPGIDQGDPHPGRASPGLLRRGALCRVGGPSTQHVGRTDAPRAPALDVAHGGAHRVLPTHRGHHHVDAAGHRGRAERARAPRRSIPSNWPCCTATARPWSMPPSVGAGSCRPSAWGWRPFFADPIDRKGPCAA